MPFFGVKPLPLLCSRRPHWTLIPLSPSCRAIVQVETRSYCIHGARCPSLASSRRRCCALAVQIGRLYRSRRRAGRLFKSRRALIAFTVLDALLWHQAAAAAVLSPSTLDVNTALAIVQSDCSSRDALLLRSRCLMPFFGVKPPPLLCSRRPHWTFTPLSPSCRAIVQVETHSALAVHIGR
jgi:hypothetical protein